MRTLLSGPIVRAARLVLRAPRGRLVLRRYRDYHEQARRAYAAAGMTDERLLERPDLVGVRVSRPGAESPLLPLAATHLHAVGRVAASLRAALSRSECCLFLPPVARAQLPAATDEVDAVRQRRVLAVQLRDWSAIDGLDALVRPLIAAIERSVYGCWAIVDKVYAYRNLPCEGPDLVSWKWHYDNHPSEVLKIMVYLTDVGEDDGAFEYLARTDGTGSTPARPLPHSTDSRVSRRAFARWMSLGHAPMRALGPAGTTVLFDANVIHRATRPTRGLRDVVVFQVRPVAFPPERLLDARWTGSFEHVDCSDDPADCLARLKTRMHSG